MIIQIRGTSGSGKSTLARQVMALYPDKQAHHIEGRKQPIAYEYTAPGRKPLYVIGHYESACGGADTISTGFEGIFNMARVAHSAGRDVLVEGLLLTGDAKRIIALAQDTPGEHLCVSLDTPVEQCLANIRQRRAAKGNDKPLSETNTRSKHAYEQKLRVKLTAAGVNLIVADYDTALESIKEALGHVS